MTNYMGIISNITGVSTTKVCSEARDAQTAEIRHIGMYMYYTRENMGLMKIAGLYQRKSHATVKHAIHRVQELLSINDSKTIQIIAAINKQIKRNNDIDMKHLLQIASNKLMITKGETYSPVSEVIITTVEPEYILLGEISENRIVKTPLS